jgi:hypothetical protein
MRACTVVVIVGLNTAAVIASAEPLAPTSTPGAEAAGSAPGPVLAPAQTPYVVAAPQCPRCPEGTLCANGQCYTPRCTPTCPESQYCVAPQVCVSASQAPAWMVEARTQELREARLSFRGRPRIGFNAEVGAMLYPSNEHVMQLEGRIGAN